MQTIIKTYTVYTFDELSEKAREHALTELYDLNVDHEWWQWTYEDAKRIGLTINEFDIDRASYVRGNLTMDLPEAIKAIIAEHGDTCETYKLAIDYQKQIKELEEKYHKRFTNEEQQMDFEDEMYQLKDDFEHSLCEEYLVILRKEYEYLTSEEVIIETIHANEYTFTEDGGLFN